MKDTILRNRYKIVEFLESGSFGDTYIAEDLDLPGKPKCVVKQLKPKTHEEEVLLVARRLFESEADVLYRLGNLSRQIPKLFAHFEEKGEFYLVQEFVPGYNLTAEIIPGNPWSEGEVVKLLQEILEVLNVVHQENIIHRDIKPQNLMRRRDDGKIVLVDFGAVKEIKGLTTDTQGHVTSTIAIGSNGYMPNEQANSKPKLCSDIYAVGVIGIQALTGKLPQDFLEDPTNGEIIWRNEVNISNKLAEVLTKMVRYHFNQRYQTAEEALQAIGSVSTELQSPSQPWSTFTQLTSKVNKKWLAYSGVGVSILLGIGFLFVHSITKPVVNSKPKEFEDLKSSQPLSVLPELPPLPCNEKSPPEILNKKPGYYQSANKYLGSSKIQPPDGRLILILETGNRYDGEFKNGKRNGCGTDTFNNGDRYIGEFIDNKYHGQGEYFFGKDQKKYRGNFSKGQYQGVGELTFANGDIFRGNFLNGKCHGKGKLFLANGTSKLGEWKDGKLVGGNTNDKCDR